MLLEEKIKAMFRNGYYTIVGTGSCAGLHSVDIDMDGVVVTAYPDSSRAIAVVSVDLTAEQAKELKRRMLEIEYNERKEALSKIEIELQELDKAE